MKKAIILAAGLGQRLGELTKENPKCLLKVGSENTLIDYSLNSLLECGIKEVIFVSGFAEEKLKKYIEKKWSGALTFKFINNPKYAEHNNIYSAYLAKDIWDDKTLLLNSDIIYDVRILKNLFQIIKLTKNKMSYLVTDNIKELTDESMKVIVDENDLIKKISKKLDLEESYGEYIGITYLRGAEREAFLKALEDSVSAGELDIYYEDIIAKVLDSVNVLPCTTGELDWTEVDDLKDLEYAKNLAELFDGLKV